MHLKSNFSKINKNLKMFSLNHKNINKWLKYSFLWMLIACESGHSTLHENLITTLEEGNYRFVKERNFHLQEFSPNVAISQEKKPSYILITCSDIILPPEVLFHQTIGTIYTIRTFGNIVGDLELKNIEYGIETWGSKLVIVMGHDHCEALASLIDSTSDEYGTYIQKTLNLKNNSSYYSSISNYLKNQNLNKDSISYNVVNKTVSFLSNKDEELKFFIHHNVTKIIGAYLNEKSGKVNFIE